MPDAAHDGATTGQLAVENDTVTVTDDVSPAVNGFCVTVPDQPKFPALLADQPEQCVQSSEPATLVHCTLAELDAFDAAGNEPCLRVVSVAAFAVPAEPGAPVCIFTHG